MFRVIPFAAKELLLIAMSLTVPQIVFAQNESQEGSAKSRATTQEKSGAQEKARSHTAGITSAMSVRELLLWKITKASEAQVEIANMAHEKFENERLNDYTKQVVEDQAMLKKELAAASSEVTRVARDNEGQQVPLELCQIIEQATENSLRVTKELLGAYEGQDFQMAYLGQQAVTLTMSLAELEAIQASASFQDLKPIVQQAISVTKRHVDLSKHLADRFEKDRK